ncbi:MAG: aminoacetone oxidase family FAD-binding enzyme, partial [Pseudomonadota bacterium]
MNVDTLIIGAGAAGLFCAGFCPGRVLVIDHAKAPGEKIRISGGGRCNFTNMFAAPDCFLSENPHFCKSALARYSQWDFIDLVVKHSIAYHEKTLGQLFCDGSAKEIIAMLLAEMKPAELRLQTSATDIAHRDGKFHIQLSDETSVIAENLVIASGGKSIPKMGATGFGYRIAEQFGHRITDTRAALVPFVFGPEIMSDLKPLAGVSADTRVTAGGTSFEEALLITHRGMSGPAALQASSYWVEGTPIAIDLDPANTLSPRLKDIRRTAGRKNISTALGEALPDRLAKFHAARLGLTGNVADLSDAKLDQITHALRHWHLTPVGTEGYRTAE